MTALTAATNNGQETLTATVIVVAPGGGTQTYSNTAALSGQTFVNAPIALTPAADNYYLLPFG